MSDVVLVHHVQGLTDGQRLLAAALGAPGRTVHAPDLFDGALPASVEEGVELVRSLGDEAERRVDAAVAGLPGDVVYVGTSWGGMHAQRLAQTRPGARGLVLLESCVSLSAPWSFGPWPAAADGEPLPVQVHGMDADPFFALEGDLDAARELVGVVGERGELFTYPGDAHLFTDASLASSDTAAAALVVERVREFLDRWA